MSGPTHSNRNYKVMKGYNLPEGEYIIEEQSLAEERLDEIGILWDCVVKKRKRKWDDFGTKIIIQI